MVVCMVVVSIVQRMINNIVSINVYCYFLPFALILFAIFGSVRSFPFRRNSKKILPNMIFDPSSRSLFGNKS